MQAIGISTNLLRVLASTAPDLLAEMFAAGKVLDAEVISVFQDRAMLSFGRGIRLEVALQAVLREGQRVKLQVQQRDPGGSLVLKLVQPAPPQQPERGSASPARPAAPGLPAQLQPPASPATQVATPLPQPQTPTVKTPQAAVSAAQPQVQATPDTRAPAASGQPQTPATQAPLVPTLPGQPPIPDTPAPQPPAMQASQPPPEQGPQAPATQAPGDVAATAPQTPVTTAQPQAMETPAPQAGSPAPADLVWQGPVGEQPPARMEGPQGRESQVQARAPQENPAPQALAPRVRSLEPQAEAPQTQGPPARAEASTSSPGLAAAGPDRTGPQATAPAQPQPPVTLQRTEPGQPPLIWIPVPLENGKQGWAQLQIQEGDPRKARTGSAQHQIRLWWETPGLGQVQVTMDATAHSLTTLITVLMAQVRARVEERLPSLQSRLAAAGFTDVQIGCRQALPGEPIGPVVPADSAARLDRRL